MSGPVQLQFFTTQEIMDNCMHHSYPVSVLMVDRQEIVVKCNPAFVHKTGYALVDIIGRKLSDFVQFDASQDTWTDDRSTGTEYNGEYPRLKLQAPNQQQLQSSYSFVNVHRETGTDCYALVMYDLQKIKEPSVLQQFSDTFMRDINLGVMLIDAHFTLLEISDMACRVLGLQREKILNRPMEEVFAAVPTEHQLVQRTILDGAVIRNHAVSWTNHDDRFELLMDSNLLRDNEGSTVGAYVIFKDVTNLRSLEEQVKRSDRLAMIGQIAAGTAHEIRNPLTSIKGFLQVLKKTLQEHGLEKEYGYTEIMLTEINRINELVSEFLLLSKPKHVSMDEVDLSTVTREILPIINNEAILHGAVIHYESAFGLPKVIADRELLKQVFINICKNGIEAMADGGILTISEKVDPEERKVLVDFHDTGPGIPSFLIDKIFDPFFTTKDEGTGLGLSVCQRIIHDIGGTIRVASKGFGTTFTIVIPYPG